MMKYLSFVDNYSSADGDAIYLDNSTLVIDASIFADPWNSADCAGQNSTYLRSNNLNLASDTSCASISVGTIELETHIEGQLNNNGGLTDTHALVNILGNSALDAVPSCLLLTDQRGEPRDSTCDIGAYEVQGSQPAPTPTVATHTPTITLTPTASITNTPTPTYTPSLTPTSLGIPSDTIRINEVVLSASGGYYLELYNYNTVTAFINDWQLITNGNTYTFGQVSIPAGDYLIFRSGLGSDNNDTI